MKGRIWTKILWPIAVALVFVTSPDYSVAESKAEAKKACEKAKQEVDKATEAADKAQKDADNFMSSPADRDADKADKQAATDEQAARDAQDKADKSQVDVNNNVPGSAEEARKDQQAADKAREKAQDSENKADAADKKADKGENKDDPHKINRQKQKEKRKKVQEAWDKCRKFKLAGLISLGPPSSTIGEYVVSAQLSVTTPGTGETIGHIADLVVQNLTDQPIACVIPPMLLESSSGKNQTYACPKRQDVALRPHELKTVPMDGVCLNRNKPPVAPGVTGDLQLNDGGPNAGHSHVNRKDADKLLRLCEAKYQAADKLEKDGALKDLPYKDKQKRKDICVQWTTWSDPQICGLTGAPPATKEDLKKVVYKQVEEQGPLTPDKKKKIDQGIDTIFEKIELTSSKAKDLEKPEGSMIADQGETPPSSTVANVSDETPSPAPEAEPKTETVYNPDGSTTTTTTVSTGNSATTTTETQYLDGSSSSKTDVKYKSGATLTQVKNRDGSTEQTSTSTDEDGTQRTTVTTIAKDGTHTTTTTEVDKDGNKKVSTTSVNSDGVWNTTSEKTNIDGTKEKTSITDDGSSTTVFTEKDGNTATTTTDNEGHAKTKTPKGSYSVDPQPDGSMLVHWNIPTGTGGSSSYPRGTTITPNIAPNADPNNSHPFIATPPPPPPLPSAGEGKKP
ncbi:MAG: cell envelope integrity protein TolA [Chthoniobacterales bacterium]